MYQELFSLQEEIFRTIGSHKRLEIIQLLHGRELTVSDMADMLDIRQSNISQHLGELRHAKIVGTRREGVKIYYHLTDERIAKACTLIKLFLQSQHNIDPAVLELMQDNESDIFPVVRDVVCKMRISMSHAGGVSTYDSQTYYFCASGCKTKFDAHPENYIKKEG
jgi:DNA-binding transcriptional ArsR family regulator